LHNRTKRRHNFTISYMTLVHGCYLSSASGIAIPDPRTEVIVEVLSGAIFKVASHDRVMDGLAPQVREPTHHPSIIRCPACGVVLVHILVAPEPCKRIESIEQIGSCGGCVNGIGGIDRFGQATHMVSDSVFVNLSGSDGHLPILGSAKL
jgi:hypothetical protein